MRTTLTRTVAGLAIAATAVLTGAGVASAGTATKTPTTLSIATASATITAGQYDKVTGTLETGTTPLVHKVVTLDVWGPSVKRWRALEEKFTNKAGDVAFTVRPLVTRTYRLVFHGNAVYAASRSGPATIKVNPYKVPTALTIAAASATITAGSTDKIGGQLTTVANSVPLGHQWVWLGVVSNGKVHLLRAFLTGKLGKVSFTIKPKVTTTYELVFRGTRKLARTVSGDVTVTVTPAS